MTNNHILKSIIGALHLNTATVLKIYRLMDPEVTEGDVADVLKDEKTEGFVLLSDDGLSIFLDGLIIKKRGPGDKKPNKKEQPVLTNNLILKKLRIALNLKEDELIRLMQNVDISFSRSELTPYFRKEGHKNYKKAGDKLLRNFIKSLAIANRVDAKDDL